MKYNEQMKMLEFDDKKVVAKVKVELPLTENDIETIIVTAFEGGSNYWMGFRKADNPLTFTDKPKDEPISTWTTKLLIEGKTVYLRDNEDGDSLLTLTLDKLVEGFRLNYINREWDNSLENGDATTSDCILQYAVFGEVVYG